MKTFRGTVAAITGAGSGIGRALALNLAGQGASLAICDVNEAGLAETVAQCEAAGASVTSQRVDVSDRTAVEAWAEQVIADHGRVNLVVNNAGVALGATIESMSYEDFEWLMNINFWGVVYGTKAFLPHLKAGRNGHIVNISSVFGLMAIPTQSAYNASKFAVRGFTDALRVELEIDDCGVSATTVHPGGIKTNIAASARRDASVAPMTKDMDVGAEFEKAARTSPEDAATVILDAVLKNKRRITIGADGRAFDVIARLPAALYQTVLVRGAKRMRRKAMRSS